MGANMSAAMPAPNTSLPRGAICSLAYMEAEEEGGVEEGETSSLEGRRERGGGEGREGEREDEAG